MSKQESKKFLIDFRYNNSGHQSSEDPYDRIISDNLEIESGGWKLSGTYTTESNLGYYTYGYFYRDETSES